MKIINVFFNVLFSVLSILHLQSMDLPLFYWKHDLFDNFGDYLSLKLVERIVGHSVRVYERRPGNTEKKFLAIGSILTFARDNDVIWGSGINGKWLDLKNYRFSTLDVRAVRGPITRDFLQQNFGIEVPEIYGDPALLLPYFFPEFKKSENPAYEYLIIPHYSDQNLFPKEVYDNVVYPTEAWDVVIKKILDSKFVISSSLHGIVVAEAFGIPARLLAKPTRFEPMFKFEDYYLGTNRSDFKVAYSLEEALLMGGEELPHCDLKKLYEAFPFEYYPSAKIINLPDEVKV